MNRVLIIALGLQFLTACQPQSSGLYQPTEAELVQACWDAGGTPNLRDGFKCETDRLGGRTPDPSKVRSARHKAALRTLAKRADDMRGE